MTKVPVILFTVCEDMECLNGSSTVPHSEITEKRKRKVLHNFYE
jgi:hypothetical protein